MLLGVLGPLTGPGLRGRRHRAVLARLIVARGRTVPVDVLVDDLWDEPPGNAAGALQTFVGDLRRALEPDRPPRTPPAVLVTEGRGYALRLPVEAVDAWRFEAVVTGTPSLAALDEALGWWRGPAYADFADRPWARAEITRLDELRLLAVQRRAEVLLASGRAAEAVPALQSLATPHSEGVARLLAEALYRSGRQADALATLRRVRDALAADLGLEAGPATRRLETAILRQELPLVPAAGLVGRDAELDRLASAAAAVHARGRLGVVLITGDAGAGKTALIEEFTRVFEGPVEVVDDLHEADEGTLRRLGGMLREPYAHEVLLLLAYRLMDPPPQLTAFLGLAARAEPERIALGALSPAGVAAQIRLFLGRDVPAEVANTIHRRSGGNPFFVRELARLHHDGGDLTVVPAGVRDVVRHRVSRLGEPVRGVLRKAAVIGRDVLLDLLSSVEDEPLDALEAAVRHGLMAEDGPGRFRFVHALVRDALYEDLSRTRRADWHLRVAAALSATHPDDVAALAHHYLAAGRPADRIAFYARRAAEQAEQRFAPREAARLWRAAFDHGPADLSVHMGLVRALALSGDLGAAHRERSAALLAAGDDPVATAHVVGAFDVPALWSQPDDPDLARRAADAARRALDHCSEPTTRARLFATIAVELRAGGGPSARASARAAEAIAREIGDPALLAYALNARFLQSFDRAGRSGLRARIGAELVETAGVPAPFRILGRLILMQASAARADFVAADRHANEADRLGDEHEVPLVAVFTRWYAAMRDSIGAPPAQAEAGFRAAAATMAGSGMTGLDGVLELALACVRGKASVVPPFPPRSLPPHSLPPHSLPPHSLPPHSLPPRDALFEARACLRATAAIEAGDRAEMERLYRALRPAAGELAGAGSGMVTLPPVARYLGDLAAALGRDEDAGGHYRRAHEVAAQILRC